MPNPKCVVESTGGSKAVVVEEFLSRAAVGLPQSASSAIDLSYFCGNRPLAPPKQGSQNNNRGAGLIDGFVGKQTSRACREFQLTSRLD